MWMFPGAFWHSDVYKCIISSIRPAIFYDGVNCCRWNGGRNNILSNVWDNDLAETYYTYGHKLAMTFSNSIIDLSDKVGNELLEILSTKDNYVILRNEPLRAYIKSKYPNLFLVHSIVGIPNEYDKVLYTELLNKYDYIVPRYHHLENLKLDFPNDLSRFEVLVNYFCLPSCPYWQEHHGRIETENRNNIHYTDYNINILECLAGKDLSYNILAHISLKQRIDKLLYMGFSRFKLAGREFPKEQLFNELEKIRKYI